MGHVASRGSQGEDPKGDKGIATFRTDPKAIEARYVGSIYHYEEYCSFMET